MLACGYARLRKHAVHTLQAIQDQGMTDPRQPDSIVAAAVTVYRKQRPIEDITVTDAMIVARMQGPLPEQGDPPQDDNAEPMPALADVEEIAF